MSRIITTAVIFLFFLCAPFAHDWTRIATKVERSIVKVVLPGFECAGFVINQKQGYALTAYHCIITENLEEKPFTVDGRLSYIIESWPDDDIAVVSGPISKPALKYRQKGVQAGLQTCATGFAYARGYLTLMCGPITHPTFSYDDHTGFWTLLGYPVVGGMSGGPVVDGEGRVVSITQRTNGITSIGRPLPVIVGHTKRYWN